MNERKNNTMSVSENEECLDRVDSLLHFGVV